VSGKEIKDEVIIIASELASNDATPRTTAEYKTEMVRVLTGRAMRQALDKISRG